MAAESGTDFGFWGFCAGLKVGLGNRNEVLLSSTRAPHAKATAGRARSERRISKALLWPGSDEPGSNSTAMAPTRGTTARKPAMT